MAKAASQGIPITIQDAATSGNGTAIAIPPSFRRHTLYITGSAGISAGAVQPEVSPFPDGPWAALGGGPITVVVSDTVVFNWEGQVNAVRCIISTTIVDGTVTVRYVGIP